MVEEKNTTIQEMWTLDLAVEFCRLVEEKAPEFGYHVGLTGGCLYKNGPRKDIDIIFYPHNDPDNVPKTEKFIEWLESIKVSIEPKLYYGWLRKATFEDKKLDLFFMDRINGGSGKRDYPVIEGGIINIDDK